MLASSNADVEESRLRRPIPSPHSHWFIMVAYMAREDLAESVA